MSTAENESVRPGAEQATRRGQSRLRDIKEPDRPATATIGVEPTVSETLQVTAVVVRLSRGLHAAEIAPADAIGSEKSSTWFGRFPVSALENLDVLTAGGSGDQWLPGEPTPVVIRSARAGGWLMAATFGAPGQVRTAPNIVVRSLAEAPPLLAPRPEPQMVVPVRSEELAAGTQREIRVEVTAHIEGQGDRLFPGSSWAGRPGDRTRIEGFSLRPLQELQPSEIEYKALHPGGIETAWLPGPQFCGTRGRNLPIVGLAIRIAPHVQDQFSVVYQGAFFRSGISAPRSNGAPCLPRISGDALEAVNVRIVRGRAGSAPF